MPKIYFCSGCKFRFKVGSIHLLSEGYAWQVYLICSQCGRNYYIRTAIKHNCLDENSENFYYCNLEYTNVGKTPILVMNLFRQLKQLTITEAKRLAYSTPVILEKNMFYSEAKELCNKLNAVGAEAKVIVTNKRNDIIIQPKRQDEFYVLQDPFAENWEWLPCKITAECKGAEKEFDIAQQECIKCFSKGLFIMDEQYNFTNCPCCRYNSLTLEFSYFT